LDCAKEFLGRSPFGDVRVDELEGFAWNVGVSGEKQDGDLWLEGLERGGDGSAMGAGHEVVEDDCVEVLGLEEFDGILGGVGGADVVSGAFEDRLADSEAEFFIVDAE
jgi:hypothetical protein